MANKSLLTCAAFTVGLVSILCLQRTTAAADGTSNAAAQPSTTGAFSQNKRLGRGVNVLGYDPIWKDQKKARFQERYFRLIKEAGFNHVRVNLHPFRDNNLGPDYKPGAAWFETLDWTLSHALANHLMVVLDFHEYQAMGEDASRNHDRMLGVWRQIAGHCKEASDDVLFEVLNEPNKKMTPALWNSLLRETLAVIRESNPRRTVIAGPTSWNNINDLDKLDLPKEDRNVIVTVHYYSPFPFTHQGASWAGLQGKTGVPWTGSEKERQAIVKDFAKAQGWAEEHDRPIYLGEFGAYDKAEMASRVRWANFVARQAEKLGWSWAWWQFDGDFVLYDTHEGHWVEPIRRALIPDGPFTYVKVSGKVTYNDGSPLGRGISLLFVPQTKAIGKAHPRIGETVRVDPKTGEFTEVTSAAPFDGVVRGKHKVLVVGGNHSKLPASVLGPEYHDAKTTPLEVDTDDLPWIIRVPKPKG
jgi:endoglucanase